MRSISHSKPELGARGWTIRIGPGGGLYPPYGRHRNPSSKYGFYLETGLRNGTTYPFLRPAFEASKDSTIRDLKDGIRLLVRLA